MARELGKLWKVKTRVVPTVIRALGTIPKGLVGHLENIGMNLDVAQIQKTASLGTARILQRVLDWLQDVTCTWNWLPVEHWEYIHNNNYKSNTNTNNYYYSKTATWLA